MSVQIYPFYKDTGQTALNDNLNGVIQFDYLRDPISKQPYLTQMYTTLCIGGKD